MPATMAKKRTKPPDQPATEPTPPAPDRHKVPVISFRPPAAMRAVLQRLADRDRRSLSQTIELLLEELLEQKGLYKPDRPAGEEG